VIERCEKCGKPFMDKSEVNRHKMYEHIVPVSPFEGNKKGAIMYEGTNVEKKETENRNNHPEELQKSITTTTTTTSSNVDTTNKRENNNDGNNYNKGVNVTQNRSRGFRSFRL
jgi:ribosomal protein L24